MSLTVLHPTLSAASDEHLVALVRQGRDDAFAELHRRHRPALARFARRLLHGTGHDPEDVVQDAFLSAYMALRRVDRPIALRPWLHMIVRNRALDHLRSPRSTRTVADGERSLALVPAGGGDPERTLELRDELREVVAAIGALPGRQRLALVAHELEGRPLGDLAADLGTSVPAAKSLLWRARQEVRAGCAPRSAAAR
jgi:RNA polymerase sigma-70 factor, ECF subfamily